MMYQSLLVAVLASTAAATGPRLHKHQHRGLRPSGSGTGPYGYGNSTGIYSNATATSTIASTSALTSTSTDDDVVTVTVQPVPVSDAVAAAVTTESTCGVSKSTTTVTSTEVVYVTVGADSSSSSVESSSVAPVVASSSSSTVLQESPGIFYTTTSSSQAAPAATTPAESTVYSTSTAAYSSSAETTVAPASTVAATSSSTSTSPTSTATSTTSSSKRGLAYDDGSLTEAFADKGMSWAYNWASSAGDILSGLDYVPLCWCPTKATLSDWTSAAQAAIDSGSTYLLSFNEPDQSGQCDIDYATAASDHQTYMNQFSGQAKIGSPAVTNGGGSMGLTYLSNFLGACNGNCAIDFLAVHWYATYEDGIAESFKSHITDAISLASENGISEVWVTEFALTGATDSETASFLDDVLAWMDSESAVGRYAFYMCADGLLVSGGSISEVVGAAYVA